MATSSRPISDPDPSRLGGYLTAVLASVKGLIVEIDRDGVLVEVLVSAPALLTRPREEQVGRSVRELFDEAMASWLLAVVGRVCDSGVAEQCTLPVELGGETRWFAADVTVAPWSSAERRSALFVTRDVTEAKRQELGRERAEHELDGFIEGAPFAVVIHHDGVILRVNAAAATCFGVADSTALVGSGLIDLVHPSDRPALAERGTLGAGRHTDAGSVRALRTDGKTLLLECLSMPLFYAGSPAVAVLCKDVTEERRLEEERRFLALIVDAAHDAISATDTQGRIIGWGKGSERLYGYTAAEAMGAHVGMLFPPGTIAEPLARERVLRGEHVDEYETARVRKDGQQVVISATLSPIFDAGGGISGIASVSRDISEQKRMQESLALAHRMASVGTLAAGLAHEINNPLAFVTASLAFAQETLSAPLPPSTADMDAVMSSLGDARLGADRIRAIVRDFKTFSRSDESAAERSVPLGATLERAVQMASNQIKHRARLEVDIGPLPRVAGPESRLGQVFVNLLVNAAQAIPEDRRDGQIRVVASTGPLGEARVRISDNGSGIAPEVLPHIFDPFFTTKSIGVGTGLGLSICHGIVSKLGGSIDVESQPGKGTTFCVVLPASVGDTVRPPLPPTAAKRVRRARILVVDDEPMVARAISRMLGRDHDVTATTHAREVVARMRSGERFDIIFSDLMMPEMSGMELFAAIGVVAPEQAQRVVFLTGGAFTPAAQSFLEEVPNQHLDKPFDRQMMTSVLAAMISPSAHPGPPPARLES